MAKPLLSIIVPVYNVEKYLEECLQSVLAQTYINKEVIIVNDGSTDSSPAIIQKYKDIPEVRIINQENRGLSGARNAALDIAKGEYYLLIDSDDYIHPQMAEVMMEAAERVNADLVISSIKETEKGAEEAEYRKYTKEDIENLSVLVYEDIAKFNLLESDIVNTVIPGSKLYKDSLFEDLRYPEGRLHEDEFIIYDLLKKAGRVAVVNEKFYYHRERPGSITAVFKVKNLTDATDALYDRYFQMVWANQFELANRTWRRMVDHIIYNYSKCIDADKYPEEYKALKEKVRQLVKERKTADSRTKAKAAVFLLSPKLFALISK